MRTYLGVSASLLLLLSLVVGCTIEEFPEALCYEDGTEKLGDDLPRCCVDESDSPTCVAHYQELYDTRGGGDDATIEAGTREIAEALATCAPLDSSSRYACQLEAEIGVELQCVSSADCSGGMVCGFGRADACEAAQIPTTTGCSFCAPSYADVECGEWGVSDGVVREKVEGCQ